MPRVLAVCCLCFVVSSHAALAGGQQPGQPTASAQGKIVAVQGRVDHAKAKQELWDPAKLFQPLYVDERVRTLAASRTAILFIDETQVKLNAGAILTVQALRSRTGGSTTLDLIQGEGWFRTKNPTGAVTVRTAAASATLRGTEINIEIRANEAVLTVTEGTAEFTNPFGSLLVSAGEEATAVPGQAPTKRVVLNPEDAVQWTLYYPARVAWHDLPAAATAGPARVGFDRLRADDAAAAIAAFQPTLATDPWTRIGASMAYAELGDFVQAREILTAAPSEQASPEIRIAQRIQLAAATLGAGDARAAREELEAVVAIDPKALRALVLLSSIELTQNRADRARELAAAAVAADPNSVAAHVAASEAGQATFDLATARRHLDRALELDATDVRALVNRARIRFGVGETDGAERDTSAAAALAPTDAQVRSLAGFIKLAQGDDDGARADFDAAIGADAAFGEPHLGLGLLSFRRKRLDEGLLEMLTATLLEPKISLYQSYLGKAYYQLKRFPEGLSALETAKRLDSRDPTPWLYSSLFLRDLYRPIDALSELRRAIALNNNRAVYRSRLLLDRDLATKNVSLAEIYRQLGFAPWGASEALNSLQTDFTNASAHLFLADTYSRLPDRSQALSGELLQYFLYAPVNLNSFNNFSEYTALLEQPLRQALVNGSAGTAERFYSGITSRSGNQRFAHVAFVEYDRIEGVRIKWPDDRWQGFFQGKLALGSSSDVFFSANRATFNRGDDREITTQLGLEGGTPVLVRQFTSAPDLNIDRLTSLTDGTVGLKHNWRPGSAFTATVQAGETTVTFRDPDHFLSTCLPAEQEFELIRALELPYNEQLGFPYRSSSQDHFSERGFNVQAQQATRLASHQLIVGADFFENHKKRRCDELLYIPITPSLELLNVNRERGSRDRAVGAFIRDEIELASRVHVTLGARYDGGQYGDTISEAAFKFKRWNPFAGLSVQVAPTTVLHVAGMRNTNASFVGARISPVTVASFVVQRNEFPTAERDEADIALDSSWGRAFVSVRSFVRDTEIPLLAGGFVPEADTRAHGVTSYFNLVLNRRMGLSADQQYVRISTHVFARNDSQTRVGLSFVHERGVFGLAELTHLRQRFGDTAIRDLPRSSFVLANVSVGLEFAAKRGRVTFDVNNLFDRRFRTIVEGLAVQQPFPERRMVASLRWRI